MKINQDRQSAFLLTHLFIKISGMRGPGALAREVGCKGRQICHLDLTLLGYGGLGPNACTGDKSRPGNVITALTYNSEDPLGDLHSLVHVSCNLLGGCHLYLESWTAHAFPVRSSTGCDSGPV